MTTLDVRMKYRFDTGLSPTYGMDAMGYNYKGGLTHEYAEWLERGNTRKRERFHCDTGLLPTYYDKNGILRYIKQYKEWMEELAVNLCWIIETFKAR
jgi:hypothetical protein